MDEAPTNEQGMFSKFGDNTYVSGSKEFLLSNTGIAKFAFLIMVVIIFMFALNLAVSFIAQFYNIGETPVLSKGLRKGTQYSLIKTTGKGAVPIFRSDNEQGGLEYTYSIWINVEDSNSGETCIFSKSSDASTIDTLKSANPGLFLKKNGDTMELNAIVSMIGGGSETISTDNLPLNKWVNVMIRVEGHNIDLLINGHIKQRKFSQDIIKQTNDNIHLTPNGGFSGMVSKFEYFSKALSPIEAMNVVDDGPNLTSDYENIFPPFLSLDWYKN